MPQRLMSRGAAVAMLVHVSLGGLWVLLIDLLWQYSWVVSAWKATLIILALATITVLLIRAVNGVNRPSAAIPTMTTDDEPSLAEATARVERYERRALALLELPRVAELMSEKEFMQHGQELIEELTGSTIAFTHFVHEDEETIELVTWSRRTLREYCTAVYDSHYPISQAGIWAEAFRQRKAVLYNDYATATNKRGLPEGHARLDRFISVPVLADGKVRMLTGVGNRPTLYSDVDVQTVQLFSNEIWRVVARRREEEAHRNLATRYHALFDANPHPTWVFDPQSLRFLEVNEAAALRYGYSRDEFLGMTLRDLIPADDLAVLQPGVAAAHDRRLSVARMQRHVNKLGALIDVDCQIQDVKYDGAWAKMLTAHDVTETRRAAESAARSEERLRLTTAMAGVAVWEFDLGTDRVSRSPTFDQLFGLPWQGDVGSAIYLKRMHPEDQVAAWALIDGARQKSATDRIDFTFRAIWPDLSLHWLQATGAVTLRDPAGGGLLARGVLMDVTERKEEAIQAAGRYAELDRWAKELERRADPHPATDGAPA